MLDSGDWRSRPITGNNSDERRNCRQVGYAHIFPSEKRAIFNGDSLMASFLLGFKATTEQSATNFNNACQKREIKKASRNHRSSYRNQDGKFDGKK